MKPQSLQTRAIIFAYLFGPPRFISRDEASRIHGAVCTALGHDDFSFRYSTPGPEPVSQSRGFATLMERAEGRGGFKVTVDNKASQEPVRLLMEYIWPPSVPHATENLDKTARAVFSTLGGTWQKVIAEVRLRAHYSADGNDAAKFMRERVIRLKPTVLDLEAPVAFASVKLETDPAAPKEGDQLFGPKRELTLEVLREDRSCLYADIMCMWPQVAAMPVGGQVQIDLRQLRRIGDLPSEYVEHAYDFVNRIFVGLWDIGR